VFERLVDNSGRYLTTANDAVTRQLFKDVPLHSGEKSDILINSKQLFRSLANNMKSRLLVCQSAHTGQTSAQTSGVDYVDFTECVKVLYPAYWPADVDVTSASCRFGVSPRPAVRAFRSFVDSGRKIIEDDLRPVISSLAVIPVSTAECERGFSCMNLLLTSTCSSLHVTTLSSLMFLKTVGPPLEQFEPLKYVKSWLAKGHHGACDVNSLGSKAHSHDVSCDMEVVWKSL